MMQNTVRPLVRRQIDLKTFDRSFSSKTLTDYIQLFINNIQSNPAQNTDGFYL